MTPLIDDIIWFSSFVQKQTTAPYPPKKKVNFDNNSSPVSVKWPKSNKFKQKKVTYSKIIYKLLQSWRSALTNKPSS